ncbi:hypothetical protein RN001_005322 [Aquatica leii]|uniref:Saccharopine dehydrogenase NADP binding domain-containing protein n=1 Tax=Aquatica leii TaxID=1421715 RepID=A0AAN7QK96_9COLE|nr:hypothetical protein RN001_005322 [Aquatica leii]
MTERLDIILFGATGYTGKYCIEYVHKLLKEKHHTWGIAGRSEEKLKQTLAEYQKSTDEDLSNIPILVADIKDEEALKNMTARAKVIINCCGPYRFYGESVVKACVETGTHHVDVSGEPQYMEQMQLNYHKAAQEKGIYIISACGFDSIPCDLGLLYTAQQFEGTLNSVEVYFQLQGGSNSSGASINYGTWESLIHSLTHANELRDLRRKLYPTPLPNFSPKLKPRASVHKCDLTDTWNVPFMGADRSVVVRTQRYLFEQKKLRPVQIQVYMGLKSIFSLIALMIFGGIFQLLVKYEFGRKLLLDHPKIFSMGFFSHEGPSRQSTQSTSFALTFRGKGWKEKLSEPEDSYDTPPSDSIVCKVSGYDPGYGVTCSAVTLAAIVILEETDKLPQSGGVYSPGAAFYDTSLLNKLQNHCLAFEVIKKD